MSNMLAAEIGLTLLVWQRLITHSRKKGTAKRMVRRLTLSCEFLMADVVAAHLACVCRVFSLSRQLAQQSARAAAPDEDPGGEEGSGLGDRGWVQGSVRVRVDP